MGYSYSYLIQNLIAISDNSFKERFFYRTRLYKVCFCLRLRAYCSDLSNVQEDIMHKWSRYFMTKRFLVKYLMGERDLWLVLIKLDPKDPVTICWNKKAYCQCMHIYVHTFHQTIFKVHKGKHAFFCLIEYR